MRWVPATDTEQAEEAEEEEVKAQLDWGGWMSGRTSAGVVELGVTDVKQLFWKCLRRVMQSCSSP